HADCNHRDRQGDCQKPLLQGESEEPSNHSLALLSVRSQLGYAIDDDLLTGLEFSSDRGSSIVLPEYCYGKFLKLSTATHTKHRCTVLLLKECRCRYDNRRLGTLGMTHSCEHFRPELALRVVQFRSNLDRSGLWIDEIADAFDAAPEGKIGKGRHTDRDSFPNSNKPDCSFRDIGRDPH